MKKPDSTEAGKKSVAMLTSAIADGLAWRTANPSKYTSDGRLKSEAVQAREAEAAKAIIKSG